jgi:hypothetical protein
VSELDRTDQARRAFDRARNLRKREVRGKVENVRRLTLVQRQALRLEAGDVDHDRPATRAECIDGIRPCPYVGCRYALYLDVNISGNLKFNFPDLEPDEMTESCALDVADRGDATLEQCGDIMNVTRERFRQLEDMALRSFTRNAGDVRQFR